MSTASKPPTRFGYKIAGFVVIAFGGIAAWPYLSIAAERLSEGRPVTAETVKAEVGKAAREKEKKGGRGFEPKAVLALGDGTVLVGGKGGLQEWRAGKLAPVETFPGDEPRGLVAAGDGAIYAAAKDGLWKRSGADWTKVRSGDFHAVSIGADGALFVAGKMGVLRSADGAEWEALAGTETDWKKPDDREEKEGEKKYRDGAVKEKKG